MENRDGVWIRDFDGAVTRIDPSTNEIVARIETSDGGFDSARLPMRCGPPGGPAGVVYRIDPSTNRVSGQVDVSASVGSPANISGIHAGGGSIWVRFSHGCVDAECTQSVGRIDPESNEVVAVADLPPTWESRACPSDRTPRGGLLGRGDCPYRLLSRRRRGCSVWI